MNRLEKRPEIRFPGNDIFACLEGRCSLGIIKRVLINGIPDSGPGRWSVPNALKALAESQNHLFHQPGSTPTRFRGRKARISLSE